MWQLNDFVSVSIIYIPIRPNRSTSEAEEIEEAEES